MGLLALAGALKIRSRKPAYLSEPFVRATAALDQSIGWDKLPLPLALLLIIALRVVYRWRNLYDTSSLPTVAQPPLTTDGIRHLTARTADGTFNDLDDPRMGSAGTRFGRNVPLRYIQPEREPGDPRAESAHDQPRAPDP